MSKLGVMAAAAVVVAAAAVLVGTGLAGGDGFGRRGCDSLAFTHNGVPWKAAQVRRVELSCDEATSVIRAYAKPRNCQFQPSCRVAGFQCRTLTSEGSTFTEHCTRGKQSVRWHGSYISS